MKKESVDPIQDAIITENVLAVLGVTMPVATSFLCYLTGLAWLDLVGEMCNGVVQIYLGYLICRENTHILMGKGVQKLDFDKILQILKSRKEVKDVIDLKTKWSNEVLLISATVNYDEGKIAENITEALDADIIKITSDEAKQKKLKNLILKSTFEFIHHTDNLVKTMEKDVRKYYPNAEFIDIEKCHSNIQSAHKGSISSSFRKNK